MARAAATAVLVIGMSTAAYAGPPYLTDDPVPTDYRHWEIYVFNGGERLGSAFDDDVGLDLNYGATENVQLTATIPTSFARESRGAERFGTGDVEVGIKYRFVKDESNGLSASIFPRVILPTSSLATHDRVKLLLPLWIGKDFDGGTSVFGGGGYEFNPGPGNRNFWQAAVAVTKDVSKKVSLGAELTEQGPDASSGTSQTRAGLGGIVKLSGPSSLLLSAGPTWSDHKSGYHFYAALGLNF
ncbi:transporter [Sphingomonas sp. ASV193]|uniref:transporter n=1 Tax=Sphingomonas sp. ASV193 TaxID=3144405 RepID=UPI0032E8D795